MFICGLPKVAFERLGACGLSWNNIRMQWEHLVVAAHLLGRTLVLPGVLQGNMYLAEGAHMPDFFDITALAGVVRVITTDAYLNYR